MKNYVNRFFGVLLVTACLAALWSCGLFKSTSRPPDAPYIKGGINFHFRGDNRLNVYHQVPHALVVCAYQLKDATAFNQTLEEKEGLSRLLECRRFDNSVNYARRLIVQPGYNIYEAMEKIDGTAMVGIVAGYYNFERKKAAKVLVLPMSGMPMFRKPGGADIALLMTDQEIRLLKEEEP